MISCFNYAGFVKTESHPLTSNQNLSLKLIFKSTQFKKEYSQNLFKNTNSLWQHMPSQGVIVTAGMGAAVLSTGLAILHTK